MHWDALSREVLCIGLKFFMPFPLPEPMPVPQVCVYGDVDIHPTAAIAPGVLLQANAGSRIVVGAGVCIGMGTVIHADGGILELQPGVTLGSAVLLVGAGTVGAGTSIGATATVINPAVAGQQLVPPGTVLGDGSRTLAAVAAEAPALPPDGGNSAHSADPKPTPPSTPAPLADQNGGAIAAPGSTIYGLAAFNELVSALFPHRRSQEDG